MTCEVRWERNEDCYMFGIVRSQCHRKGGNNLIHTCVVAVVEEEVVARFRNSEILREEGLRI